MSLDDVDLPREERLVLAVCRPDPYPDRGSDVEQMLAGPLDWNRIAAHIAKHKVLPLFWDRLRGLDLIRTALRSGGLSKLWAHYFWQLYVANRERSHTFMTMLTAEAAGWADAGLRLAVLKGGALIGSLYTPANRMLHDIDLAADRAEAGTIRRHFAAAGYVHGVFDDSTGDLRPLGRKPERMWLFYNHTLPPFYKATGSALTPFHKVQVGFNLFDTHDDSTFDLAAVASSARPKADGSGLLVPRPEHMLLNLCSHIYREGVSLVYADVNDNWQLIKFCDLLGYLYMADDELDREDFQKMVVAAGLEQVCAFAFHYTALVYPDDRLAEWCRMFPTGEEGQQGWLREGTRLVTRDGPFERQLFSLRPHRTAQSRWNQSIGQEEW